MEPPKGRILIVDDVTANIQVLHGILSDHQEIFFAVNGPDALRICQEKAPDLILLDVGMPGMDGFEVCRRLKEDERTRNTMVVFVTALDGEADEMRGLELGASDFLSKPVRPGVVRLRVENLLKLRRYQEQLERIGLHDGLTGIPNRRQFDLSLETEWKRAQRTQRPLSLVLIDIDFFKQYNDRYGHPQGDHCLTQVARVLEGSARRPMDLAARYGGEEFAVILPETDLEGAMGMAETMRQAISDLRLPHEGSQVADHVTVSLGVGSVRGIQRVDAEPIRKGDLEGVATLIHLADLNLYVSKRKGRNRVSGGSDA